MKSNNWIEPDFGEDDDNDLSSPVATPKKRASRRGRIKGSNKNQSNSSPIRPSITRQQQQQQQQHNQNGRVKSTFFSSTNLPGVSSCAEFGHPKKKKMMMMIKKEEELPFFIDDLKNVDLSTLIEDDGDECDQSLHEAVLMPTTKSIKRPLVKSVSNELSMNQMQRDQLPWTEKYKPQTLDQLQSVNKKKIEELNDWFEFVFKENHPSKDDDNNRRSNKDQRILIISGPTGCGKTLAVQLIAKDFGVNVIEFSPRVLKNDARDWAYAAPDEDLITKPTESQFQDFKKYLVGANHSFGTQECLKGKLILLKDLPTTVFSQTKAYQKLFEQYLDFFAQTPLVFIFGNDQESSRMQDQLFPKNIVAQNCTFRTITFNPVTLTAMKKVLTTMMNGQVSKEFLAQIHDSSGGDLRNAINLIELTFKHPFNESRNRPPPSKKCKSLTLDQRSNLSFCFGGKDSTLLLFHFLGKIFYCKREPVDYFDKTIVEQLPIHLHVKRRHPLKENPERLIDQMITETGNKMIMWLQQNYAHFVGHDLQSATACASWLSLSDAQFCESWNAEHLEEYQKCLALRGIMYNLPNSRMTNTESGHHHQYRRSSSSSSTTTTTTTGKSERGTEKMYRFVKPIHKEHQLRLDSIQQLINGFSQSSNLFGDRQELIADVLPYMWEMGKNYQHVTSFAQHLPSIYQQRTTGGGGGGGVGVRLSNFTKSANSDHREPFGLFNDSPCIQKLPDDFFEKNFVIDEDTDTDDDDF